MLVTISWISLAVAFLCALIIIVDELRHPQHMGVMNIVWPANALYLSVFGLWSYFKYGRRMTKEAMRPAQKNEHTQEGETKLHWYQYAISTAHCGAGCALGDIFAEFTSFAIGFTVFGVTLWGDYVLDYATAWTLGIVFQYFAIKPMKNLSAGQAIAAAIKADTLSITAFQVGMYAFMALTYFVLFPSPHLMPNQAAFWFLMQIAMVLGFLTSYPMNVWLVKKGVKEAMG